MVVLSAALLACGAGCAKEVAPAPMAEPPPPPPPPPPPSIGPTIHSANIRQDEVWLPSGNPHLVTRPILVAADWGCAFLDIRPGCVVRFAPGASIRTFYDSDSMYDYWECGSIDAVGTPDSIIVFTADSDSAGPGYWAGILAGKRMKSGGRGARNLARSEWGEVRLEHCRIEWAGEAGGAAVTVSYLGKLSMTQCTIRGSAGKGARLAGAVWAFNGNTITGCRDYAIEWNTATRAPIADCTLTGNAPGRDAILLNIPGSGRITSAWDLKNLGAPLVIPDGKRLRIEGSDRDHVASMTIGPGVTLRFGRGSGIEVGAGMRGAFVADGTEGRITLESASLTPAPGDWTGIRFGRNTVDEESRMVQCRVTGAGGDGAAIVIEDARPTIRDCRIERNFGLGFTMFGRDVPDPAMVRRENIFYANTGGDLSWDPGPAGTVHSFDIIGTNEVWDPWGNPHRVVVPMLVRPDLPAGRPAALRILPGCVVQFSSGAGLGVEALGHTPARIDAEGSAESPIRFTGEGDPAPAGSWVGLTSAGWNATLNLARCRIEAAGQGGAPAVAATAAPISGPVGGLRMIECEVRGNAGPGCGLFGNTLAFRDNVITGNAGDAVRLFACARHDSLGPNALTGNAPGHDLVHLFFNETLPLASLSLPDFGVPYVVMSPAGASAVARAVPAWRGRTADSTGWNPTLTFGPGSTVLFERGAGLEIGYGWDYLSLVADGTSAPIVFDGVEGEPGSWRGIVFGFLTTQDGTSRLIHCRIAHGGSTGHGNIEAMGARPVIRDCDIRDSSAWGIWLGGPIYPNPDSLEAQNRFEGNASGSVKRPL
jgi:hypothetical protein